MSIGLYIVFSNRIIMENYGVLHPWGHSNKVGKGTVSNAAVTHKWM